MSPELIAQVVSIATIITVVMGLFSPNKQQAMLWFCGANVALLTTYLLLGRFLGAILVLGATARTLVYFYYAHKKIKPSVVVLVLFELFNVVVSIFLWKDYSDIIMLVNLGLVTYTTWQNNMTLLRFSYIISSMLLIAYDVLVGAYVSIIPEIIVIAATVVSLIRFKNIQLKSNLKQKE